MAIVTKEKLDRVYDAYRNGKLSRRHFIKYLGLAGASMGLIRIALRNAVRRPGRPNPSASTAGAARFPRRSGTRLQALYQSHGHRGHRRRIR
jgi:hypothetical protein